ncbi:MAG: carboxypeptidase regulatory-like domain-containing protein [Pyrinomonadaceae bacterium]
MLKLPASQAQTEVESDVQENQSPETKGKITEYSNGVMKIEPQGFSVTGAVREMPTVDPDALVKRANYVNRKEYREERLKAERREKGIYVDENEGEDINKQNEERIKIIIPGAGAGYDAFQDPLVKRGLSPDAPQAMPAPSLTFDGATQADNAAQGIGAVAPPDVNGDVGPNHFVSSVNLVLKMFNKSGVVVAGPIKTSDLFLGLPAGDPCRTRNDGDPIVMYDSLADRWHISQFSLPSSASGIGNINYQCVALSVTGDPTGAYYVWSYPYPGGAFNDYPKVGVWTDAYHMTFNQFGNPSGNFIGAGFLSQDRKKALVGDPGAVAVYINLYNTDPNAGGLLPGDIDGLVAPPAALAEVIGEFRANEFGNPNDAIRLYKWVPNFTNPGSSTLTILPDVVLAPFDARQPTVPPIEVMGGNNLDAIADRSMHRFAYHNLGTNAAPINSYVGNFTVNVSGVAPTNAATYQAGVRWFEMRRTNDIFSVFDQGTHNLAAGNGATGLNNWMSSIAQDNIGDIALGFSQAGTTQRADIKIAGRTNNIQNSGTLNEGEALFFAAGGSQTNTSRWGDYSAMNVDPTDDCTFWYTQEYYATTSARGWSTRVGKFRFPQCTDAPKATIQGTVTNCATGLPINQASVDATGGFNRLTIANGTYSMMVSPGTYTVSANKLRNGFNTSGGISTTVANGGTTTVNICLTGVPVINVGSPQVVSESCAISNSTPEPGEELIFSLPLQNTGAISTTNLTATLQATGGVINPGPAQSYGALAPDSAPVTKNFNFKVNPALACGSFITLTWVITDGATNFGNVTYTVQTGTTSAATTTSYTGPPVAIPDAVVGGVNITLPVSGITGLIGDVNFRLDALAGCNNTIDNLNASVTHTYLGDLKFKLISPEGTTVNLILNRGGGGNNYCTVTLDDEGGFPAASSIPTTGGVTGNFTPESPLSAFNGQNANGNWTLNVSDVGPTDIGTLNRFSLIIAPKVCSTGCVQGIEADLSPRPNGNGVVSSTDVSLVQGFQLGLGTPYQSNEFQRADCAPLNTKGNGAVTSIDVSQAQSYQLGFNALQLTAGPTSIPEPGSLLSTGKLFESKSNYNQSAVAAVPREVKVVNTTATVGQNVTVFINVDAMGDESVYGFSLIYDETKLSNPVVTIGTAGGAVLSNTTQSGRIGISVSYGGNTIMAGNNRNLAKIQFTVAANAMTGVTPLTFGDTPTFREVANAPGMPGGVMVLTTTFTNVMLTITNPIAASVSVGGRLSSDRGRGVANAQITLTNSRGEVRVTRSNGFGYFKFTDVAAGETYIITVRSKQYTFASRAVNVTQDLDNVNFTAQPRE